MDEVVEPYHASLAMNIVFFGTPDFAVPSLKRLLSHPDITVQAIVTQPDKRRGRGNQCSPSPVKAVALEHGLPIWQPQRIKKDEAILAHLAALAADAFVVIAYGQILSQQILDMPRLGCINAHGSILPCYRGAAPIQWCLYHGESETGITTMLMDAGMDTGPALLEARTPIDLLDNAHTLADRLADLAADLVVTTLQQLAQHSVVPTPQDPDRATYAPLIQKADYELAWQRSALALHNQVRGFYPNGVTTFRSQPLKVIATLPLGQHIALPAAYKDLEHWEAGQSEAAQPGQVIEILKGLGPIVQTGEGYLLLREVQMSGKRPMSGWDFVNGARVTIGDSMG